MGVTAGEYGDSQKAVDPDSIEPYSEEGSDVNDVDRTSFTGTIDTSGVGPGSFEDLRNVTRTFDRADETLAQQIEKASSLGEAESETGVVVEGADDDLTPAEVADSLRERGQRESKEGVTTGDDLTDLQRKEVEEREQEINDNLAGKPYESTDEAQEDARRAQGDADGSGGSGDQDLVDNPGDGSQKEVEEAVGDDPEKAEAALEAEKEGDNRKGLTASLERTIEDDRKDAVDPDFNPLDHSANEVKDYLSKVTDEEIERVKALEETRTPVRTSIANYER